MAKKTIKRLCIFAHYDPHNLIDDYVVFYIKSLSKLYSIIFVSDNNLSKKELKKISKFSIKQIAKKHGKYDFGSYQKGFLYAKNNNILKKYDWLLFANDSCYGPLHNLDKFITTKENNAKTAYGMTVNTRTYPPHIQSYFIGIPKNIFLKNNFYLFFKRIEKEENKESIVEKYEYGLSKLLTESNIKFESFFNDPLFKYDPLGEKWLTMIKNNFPFLKKNLFKDNINNVNNLYQYKKLSKYFPKKIFNMMKKNLIRTIPKEVFEINTSFLKRMIFLYIKKPFYNYKEEGFSYILMLIRDSLAKIIKKIFKIFNIDILKYKRQLEILCFKQIYKKRFKKNLSLKEKKFIICQQYKSSFGRYPNLINPKTFNEKIQWLKLNYYDPIMTMCADKYLVKNYIRNTLGDQYVIPTIGVWDNAKKINFDKLPDEFVLKTNWGSGQNIIIRNKEKINKQEIVKKLNSWIKPENNHYFYSFEKCYESIQPKIFAEKYIPHKGKDILDYKIMCYNGEPKNLFVCSERSTNLKVTFFDLKWNKLPFKRQYETSSKIILKPKNLKKMIKFAEKISKPFPFARVDFYNINGKIYFGEITFYPGNGTERFSPEIWDYNLGKLIKLPHKNV